MSWTVACFCGTVFKAPVGRCPTCGTPVPEVTTASSPSFGLSELPLGIARLLHDGRRPGSA